MRAEQEACSSTSLAGSRQRPMHKRRRSRGGDSQNEILTTRFAFVHGPSAVLRTVLNRFQGEDQRIGTTRDYALDH